MKRRKPFIVTVSTGVRFLSCYFEAYLWGWKKLSSAVLQQLRKLLSEEKRSCQLEGDRIREFHHLFEQVSVFHGVYRIQCFGSVFIWYGSGSSPDPAFLWPKIGKIIFFSFQKLQFVYPYASIKDVPATEAAFRPLKRTYSTSKHEISYFFLFLRVIFPSWIRIRIPDPDTDHLFRTIDLDSDLDATVPWNCK